MLAENLADNTTAHEPQSHQPFPSLCKEVSSTDIQVLSVLSEQINVSGEAEKLEGAVRMEVEGDDEFIVEDKDEQVSMWIFNSIGIYSYAVSSLDCLASDN